MWWWLLVCSMQYAVCPGTVLQSVQAQCLNFQFHNLLFCKAAGCLTLYPVSFCVNELRGKNWINFLGERGDRVELSACIPPTISVRTQNPWIFTLNHCIDCHNMVEVGVYSLCTLYCMIWVYLSKLHSRQWQWNGSWVHAGAVAGVGPQLGCNSILLFSPPR